MDKSELVRSSLPGGISVTHLRVYDFPGPDGLPGGSPHMHFACTEAYFVLGGNGAVQTLSNQGHREIPLRSGSVVWFTPGVIHRLINYDGQLEIYVVMENQGLPEHGDSVLTFPDEYLRSEAGYLPVASLSPTGSVYADSHEAATRRRDLAVNGFLSLRDRVEKEGVDALRPFYERAVKLMQPKESQWRQIWIEGPVATIGRTESCLNALKAGSSDYLSNAAVLEIPIHPETETRKLGFCGTLRLCMPEGITVG